MLRIISTVENGCHRWVLSGQLAGPWVAEFKAEWSRLVTQTQSARPLIDLSDVTFIDESGEELLREMQNRGAQFVARGVETRHILENLAGRERPQLRRFLGSLRDGNCS